MPMDDVNADVKSRLQTDRPHSARVWNYLLGGKDNYPVDSEVGDAILSTFPEFAAVARLQRAFLARAVRFLAAEAGIRQFLDIGTGLPSADNTHEVAQRIAPDSRIVYVDNDPLVLAHARALLTSSPEGACAYISEDVRNPERILAEAAKTLDFSRPVALTLLGIMGQLSDADRPRELVATLLEALPAGSYVALSDGINTNDALNTAVTAYNAQSANTYHLRSPEDIAAYFTGLDVVEPGIVATSAWRPDDMQPVEEAVDVAYCGVARKV
ncbi:MULTISPECIES: SAM-dependent methyltransferase [unclassified Streptomyces]|uniref:SAM-dependent methyltransferase n=1 Tax=unclassified Streptomyces TaxID=2593676 RepID=UPI000DBA7139|nr:MULTISPECIES: SAM-dependent methyltransferase [unclassified Streptomyces]MYT70381.1 SAM-dependent methyltransferase [Streptomyces sp. SID8367]RAJ70561.1 S-adenosyl methyltransferase [Streptomyces sp. PsTaAH-137]